MTMPVSLQILLSQMGNTDIQNLGFALYAIIEANQNGDVVGPVSSVTSDIAVFTDTTGKAISDGGQTIAQVIAAAIAGSGNVTGPAVAIDSDVAVFDTTTGKLIKDGGQTIAQIVASSVPAIIQTPYVGTDFSATGSMTWSVDAGDLSAWAYSINGKDMKIWLNAQTTTVGGTVAGQSLTFKIPTGKLAARTQGYPAFGTIAGGGVESVLPFTTAGSNIVTIVRYSAANFVVGTNNTAIQAVMDIEIQ